MGSGRVPPSLPYKAFSRRKSWPRTQLSSCTSPGASSTFHFHWAQRPELTKLPSFSIQWVQGKKNTSVSTFLGSTPGARQNSDVAVGSGSMTTSHLSFDSDWLIRLESGPMLTPDMPAANRPSRLPERASSWIVSHDEFFDGLGIQE